MKMLKLAIAMHSRAHTRPRSIHAKYTNKVRMGSAYDTLIHILIRTHANACTRTLNQAQAHAHTMQKHTHIHKRTHTRYVWCVTIELIACGAYCRFIIFAVSRAGDADIRCRAACTSVCIMEAVFLCIPDRDI